MFKQIVSAGVLVALVGAGALKAEILEQVLVKVNGEILTKTEFEQRQVAALRDRPELANASPVSPELRKAVAELTPTLILQAVDEMLIVQRGRELNYSLGDEQFNSIVANLKKQNNIEDEAKFQALLKAEGLTMADVRRTFERSMLMQQVQRVDVMDKISVNDEEARAFFEANRQSFTTSADITLREILIEVPATEKGVNVAQDDEARAKAEDVRKRLLAGEPFARLAGDLSAAPSRANGGLIGPIKSDELATELQQRLVKMAVGDLMDIQRTSRGYQILKLEARTDAKAKTFEEARGQIADRLAEQKFDAARLEYLDRLRAQAAITWRNQELKAAYEQALGRRSKPTPNPGVAPPPARAR